MKFALQPPRVSALLVGLTLLALVQFVLAMGSFLRLNNDLDEGFRLPLPSRVADIVSAIEFTDKDNRDTLLGALNDHDFLVWIVIELEPDQSSPEYPVENIARAVDRYVNELGNREVIAWISPDGDLKESQLRFERLRLWSNQPMRLAISLKSDEWLLIETRGQLPEKVFGFPPGFWAGLFGIVVAVLSLIVLWRGLGPMRPLSRQVSQFAETQTIAEISERGPRETRDVTRAINNMQHKLSDLIQERQLIFASMSHDLRTYLTRLRLRIEFISDANIHAKAEQDLEDMVAIVENGLAFTRLETEPLDLKNTDIIELLEGLLAGDTDDKPFSYDAKAGPFKAYVNAPRLRRALLNLIQNAQRHGGSAQLKLDASSDSIRISIFDDGQGIPTHEIPRLLKPFERGDTSRSLDTKGTGLGLAIAGRIIDQHGGSLQINNRKLGGLEVIVSLPRSRD